MIFFIFLNPVSDCLTHDTSVFVVALERGRFRVIVNIRWGGLDGSIVRGWTSGVGKGILSLIRIVGGDVFEFKFLAGPVLKHPSDLASSNFNMKNIYSHAEYIYARLSINISHPHFSLPVSSPSC